ncbi:hypothetical protein HG264_08085 [Pseudomonas sp. gcc21]|uniref:hypothetical protein n=1 Tax=Pseudomonas sp. gcc21 TaxID=2726989 RepID=UPI00145185A2|nr:hypothetical protein [Pseudomonas sp. gcc21]QJD58871.1 hypothetical protein HG264_08085 [Pseudomonas sp. gcc21]
MNELKDQSIQQGTRKRTEYEDARRARLALNIDRTDGGTLQIVIENDMRSHEEEPEIQQNTFLAVMPLARLPGYDRYNQSPKGALPRAGRIYVFRKKRLWRELVCDGKGNLSDVDVTHWRRMSEKQDADIRPAVGKEQALVLVPMLLQGRFVGNEYQMAYSELPWTWEYISWLEERSDRISARCHEVGPAWAAAMIGGERWSASQAMPVLVIDKETEGLRPRDFSVESLMDDPALFKPALANIPAGDWAAKLQRVLEQLAAYERADVPQPLTNFAAVADVLAERSLRGYPKLVGLMLDDPLFTLRHAIAQIRQAEHYLLALNALIPHVPNGRYAQVLHSTVMHEANNPLSKFRAHLDTDQLNDVVFELPRRDAREYMEGMLKRLIDLFDGRQLTYVAQDWLMSRDERLLEPYVLLAEALDALCKNPAQSDALCLAATSSGFQRALVRLSQSLLSGTHELTRTMLAGKDGELPEAVIRIQALARNSRSPEPKNMGLSSLLQIVDIDPEDTDRGMVFKNLNALVADAMEYFSLTVLTHINRLKASEVLIQVDFHRLFAPSLGVLSRLSPKWRGLQLMKAGEAQAQNLRIVGVNTGNLRYGLTPTERTTLSRKHYLYGNILDHENRVIGSSSPRQLGGNLLPNQGSATLIVAPENHPEVHRFNAWKTTLSSHVETVTRTPALPLVAVACALYNLQAQSIDMKGLLSEGTEGDIRYQAGKILALADLATAIGSIAKPLSGQGNGLVYLLNKPRFGVPKPFTQWRANLIEQTGSSKLPILRSLSGGALLYSAVLCAWDAKRAWHQGDRDAALAYGMAATGGAAWGAYVLGMSINPIVLAAGAVLFIGGSIIAGWLIDSDIEALLKNGPFGRQHGRAGVLDSLLGDDERFAHLADPQNAYIQLLGILGKPVVRVERLADWMQGAPHHHSKKLERISGKRMLRPYICQPPDTQPLEADDWIVTLHSPLLSMFGLGGQFRLHALEQVGVLPLTGIFDVERVEHRVIGDAKVSALPLDDATVVYVLPKQFPLIKMTSLQCHDYRVTQRLQIMAQFRIDIGEATGQPLVLPQPSPKRWKPYNAAFLRTPSPTDKLNEAPYWLIETTEFKV